MNDIDKQRFVFFVVGRRELHKLLAKYESAKEQMLVMDDYDGGMMHMTELIVRDLKKLKKDLDINEKTGTLEV